MHEQSYFTIRDFSIFLFEMNQVFNRDFLNAIKTIVTFVTFHTITYRSLHCTKIHILYFKRFATQRRAIKQSRRGFWENFDQKSNKKSFNYLRSYPKMTPCRFWAFCPPSSSSWWCCIQAFDPSPQSDVFLLTIFRTFIFHVSSCFVLTPSCHVWPWFATSFQI